MVDIDHGREDDRVSASTVGVVLEMAIASAHRRRAVDQWLEFTAQCAANDGVGMIVIGVEESVVEVVNERLARPKGEPLE